MARPSDFGCDTPDEFCMVESISGVLSLVKANARASARRLNYNQRKTVGFRFSFARALSLLMSGAEANYCYLPQPGIGVS
jgi:hypothetical protein